MTASVFDSALLGRLFDTGAAGRLFSDTADVRAMLIVEGALARVQASHRVIPEISAAAISRAAMEIQIDPGQLATLTGENGVSVPALVAAFRDEMNAPEHAQYVHWGATSQDIIDTSLMLRLRQVIALIEESIASTLAIMADMADEHADTPMAGRTYGQHATPTSFGAVVAAWGYPLVGLMAELPYLRRDCLIVSLSGAAGTSSELGPAPDKIRADLAEALGLGDPKRSWHVDRAPLLRIAEWLNRVSLAHAKMGEDLIELVQTGIGEIRFGNAGASSTMPQKQNPVGASVLVALARQSMGLMTSLQSAAMPRHQRDGTSWFTEWMCLPQIALGAAAASQKAQALISDFSPVPDVMHTALTRNLGMIHAEALSFALTAHVPRPKAQAAVKSLCREAQETGQQLADLVARDWPDLKLVGLFDPGRQMGHAPAEARRFAQTVRASQQLSH